MGDTNPFDDPKLGADLVTKNPFDDPNLGAPRGVFGELGTALKRGALVDLPTMVGKGLQYTGDAGGVIHDFGADIVKSAEARGMQPGNVLQPEQHGAVVNALAAGAQMVPSVVAPAAAVAGAIAAAPVSLPTLAATAVTAAGVAAPFAMQAGQETLEKGRKVGNIPEDTVKSAARMNAGLTFGTQFGVGMVGGQMLGRSASAIGNLVSKEAAPLAERTMAELVGSGGVIKPFLKQLPESAAEATALGAAQAAGSAAIERSAGIDTRSPSEAAGESIPGMLGLTAVMSPFGLAGRAVRAASLHSRAEALANKDTHPILRDQLAMQYYKELNKVDPQAAQAFILNAETAIKHKIPLQVDNGLFQEGAVISPQEKARKDALAKGDNLEMAPATAVPPTGDATGHLETQALSRASVVEQAIQKKQAEDNQEQYVHAHDQIVAELKSAGITPSEAMPFAAFKKFMRTEAKKAGMTPDTLTPAYYEGMWKTYQAHVMEQNIQKGHDLAAEPVLNQGNKPLVDNTNAVMREPTALELALQDAQKRKETGLAHTQRERELERIRAEQTIAIQNRTRGAELADAAEKGMVPPDAQVLPSRPAEIITELRATKPDEMKNLPPKIVQEVTKAVAGKESYDAQMQALRELRDSKKTNTISYELLDKLHEKLNPKGVENALSEQIAAAAVVRPAPENSAAVGEGNAKPEVVAGQEAPAKGNGKKTIGRPEGSTDDRHTIGPPTEVSELVPYTRTLADWSRNSRDIFAEKQWWQDLAWALRNPESKIGKELLENGKFTDEQMGLALQKDERYQAQDKLYEQMRVERDARLQSLALAESQPEKAKKIFSNKDLANIFGGEEDDFTLDKRSTRLSLRDRVLGSGDTTPAETRFWKSVFETPADLAELRAEVPSAKFENGKLTIGKEDLAAFDTYVSDTARLSEGERLPPSFLDRRTKEELRKEEDPGVREILGTDDQHHDAFVNDEAIPAANTVAHVLDKMQGIVKDPMLKQLIAQLQKLGLDTTISTVDVLPANKNAPLGEWDTIEAQYHPAMDHIFIADGGAKETTVLHEIVHAATISKLQQAHAKFLSWLDGDTDYSKMSPSDRKQIDNVKELMDLYLDAKDRAKEKGEYHYGVDPQMYNVAEFVAEAMANPEFQKFLKGADRSLWTRVVDFVKNLLGIKASPNVLDRVMSLSNEFVSSEKPAPGPSLNRFERSPRDAAEQTDQIVSGVSAFVDNLAQKGSAIVTAQHLAWTSLNHIKQVFAGILPEPWAPALHNYIAAKDSVAAMIKERNHAGGKVYEAMRTLDPKAEDALYRAMGESTRLSIDPRIPFEEQPRLDASDRRAYNRIRDAYNVPGVKEVYDRAAEHNRQDYDNEHAVLIRNQAYLAGYDPALLAKIDVTKGLSPETKAAYQWLTDRPPSVLGAEDIRTAARATLAFHQERTQGPYFHLGRSGDYYARFTIKDTPEARAAAEKMFGTTGMTDTRRVGVDDLHVFARFEKIGEQAAVGRQLEALGAAGHLEPGWQSGLLAKNYNKLDTAAPSFIHSMMARIDTDTRLSLDQQAEFKDTLRRMYIEMLPETSASKAFAKRQHGGVAGYDADMGRSFVKRTLSSSYFVAHNGVRPELAAAEGMFRQGVAALAQDGPYKDNKKAIVAQAILNELHQRQANEMTPINSPALDGASALGYSFYLAGNPAFILSNLFQPVQLTLPYLGAKHGFVNSSKEMFKASKLSWNIIKDTIGDGWVGGGWKGILDADISIDNSKASTGEKAFLKAAVASGQAEWTQAHELGRVAEGGNQTVNTAAKLGGSLLHYSEAVNRMTTGLAAFNLEMKRTGDQQKAIDFGIQAIKDTQFDYSPHNKGRMLGKHGFFGPYTPLVTQFMQFNIQTLELLGRLGMKALNNDSPGARAEALKTMGGIMATTTALAGTLGLPFAGLVSAAYNNLLGSKDQPVDMVADYRNWLTDIFGKDAGEIIAHGGLRATGADFASHLDFANIVPFTQFLNDRRKLKDRFDAGAFAMMGPVVGAGAGIALGVNDIANGDIMKGLAKALPSALKGPVKAVDLASNDYHDAHGNRLPINATPWDIAVQAANFTPTQKAEQGEAQRSVNTTATLLKQRAADLREHFANAMEKQDSAGMADNIQQITAFNTANPDYAIRNLGGILKQRAIERAVGVETNVEGKVRQLPRLQAAARFANIRGMP